MNTNDNSVAVGRTLIAAAVASVLLEGHTGSVGSDDYNLGLSQRRAGSVRSYLVSQGVDAARVTAMGAGAGAAVASNGSAAGRQQNRRVEVIISNPALPAL